MLTVHGASWQIWITDVRCVQRQKLTPARVPACAWDVFLAIDLSSRELVALPRRDTRSKTSQKIRRPPDE